jgi:hypothetical protein
VPGTIEPMPTKGPPSASVVANPARQTLSELLARILEQLSLSAWLPSGVLVFSVLVLGSLRAKGGDMDKALTALGDLSIASLVLLLTAVVLATVLTQAFQFEAIRVLEGYWGPGRLREAVADARCRRHLARRDAFWTELENTAQRAFKDAAATMLAEGVPASTVEGASRVFRKEATLARLPAAQRDEVEAHPWQDYGLTKLLRRMDALAAAARRFPHDDRAIQPTRLGNMLRHYEDPIEHEIGRPIEGFVQEIFHLLPPEVQADHDHFRARLDLYCALVIVFVITGVSGVALLIGVDVTEAGAAGAAGVALAWLSYRAAVTSARVYGAFLTTLVQFDRNDRRAADDVSA